MYECKDGVCSLKQIIKCKNYTVCKNIVEEADKLCIDCNHIFGDWRNRNDQISIKDTLDLCPVCETENTTTVHRLDCEHYLCTDCFRKIYFGIEIQKPKFTFGNSDIYKDKLDNYNRIKDLYLTDKFTSKCFQCC